MTQPRLLTKKQVGEYLGLSKSALSQWITKGRIPNHIPGTRMWDRRAIDATLDRISGIEANDNEDKSDALKELENLYG